MDPQLGVVEFYSHQQPNYALSNFYPHVPGKKLKSSYIVYQGLSFPTSEHLYQALKFKWETPDELLWLEHIRTASTPGIAKHLGHFHRIRRYTWQQNATALVDKYRPLVRLAGDVTETGEFRISIMRTTLKAKYDSCPEFAQLLLATYPHRLQEASDDDWGRKSNWLGTLLEELRANELAK